MTKFFLVSVFIISVLFCIAGNSYGEVNSQSADCPRIKLKRQWGGKLSTNVDYRPVPVKYVVIHHTVTPECSTFLQCAEVIQNIQHYHINSLDLNDIGYNFLIGNDGLVYEGTGWYVTGAHTYGYNRNGTGIAFIGDFSAKLPSDKALDAAKHLLKCGVKIGTLHSNYELYAGSQLISTQSPGLMLYNEIQEWDNWSPNP